MGTTLTGTTPQDTYDSLIKVTDNGPLSGTLKALSDGLGNDSTLSLSTTAASIAGTLAVSGAATFDTTTLVVDATNDRVGIGTSSPTEKLHIVGAADVTVRLQRTGVRELSLSSAGITASSEFLYLSSDYGALSTISLTTNSAERMRITAAGVVELAQGQIKFPATQVPSADANTLDDYEEGTFTPTIIGSTTAGTATYGGGQEGKYTKIGNVVYFQIYLGYSGGTGTGDLRIAGLPFTVPANDLPSFTFGVFLNIALTASNVPIAGGIGSTNQIYINQIPTGGGSQTSVPYDDSAVIQISGFYRV